MARYFLDTEFNGMGGELLSIALVRDDGHSYYSVFDSAFMDLDPWVAENVVPLLFKANTGGRIRTPEEAAADIAHFLQGDPDPVIVTDWPDDIRYFCGLVITGPGQMIDVPGLKFEMHRVDAYPTTLPDAVQHNAWWDAMALRHLLSDAA